MGGKRVASGIQTISLGSVNCYLVPAGRDFVLIDTSLPQKRAELEAKLARAGCVFGTLKLIVLTHGDYDHAGNAAHLRERFGAKIVMHPADAGRVELADWSWNVKPKPDRFALPFRLVSRFVKPGPFDVFQPDAYVEDGQLLSDYGFDARILHLPGHTKGSIGVLTADGALFCGDLFDSLLGRPSLHFFIDDMAAAKASLQRLRTLPITTVHPGHGRPFRLDRVKGDP